MISENCHVNICNEVAMKLWTEKDFLEKKLFSY